MYTQLQDKSLFIVSTFVLVTFLFTILYIYVLSIHFVLTLISIIYIKLHNFIIIDLDCMDLYNNPVYIYTHESYANIVYIITLYISD